MNFELVLAIGIYLFLLQILIKLSKTSQKMNITKSQPIQIPKKEEEVTNQRNFTVNYQNEAEVKSIYFLFKNQTNKTRNFDIISKFLLKYSIISKVKAKKGMSYIKKIIEMSQICYYTPTQNINMKNSDMNNKTFNIVLFGSIAAYGTYSNHNEIMLLKKMKANSYFGHRQDIEGGLIEYVQVLQHTYILQFNLNQALQIFQQVIVIPQIHQQYQNFRSIPIFTHLQNHQIHQILEQSTRVSFIKDDTIYTQGDYPQYLYYVIEGEFGLFEIRDKYHRVLPVTILTTHQIIGIEQILLQSTQRNFSLKCISSKGQLIQISRNIIVTLLQTQKVGKSIQDNIQKFEIFLSKNNLRKQRVEQICKVTHQISVELQNSRLENNKVSFKEKNKFYNRSQNQKYKFRSVSSNHRNSYLTSKKQPTFQSEQSLYQSKINAFKKIIQVRYGGSFDNKFTNIFSDFYNNGLRKKYSINYNTNKYQDGRKVSGFDERHVLDSLSSQLITNKQRYVTSQLIQSTPKKIPDSIPLKKRYSRFAKYLQ